MLVAILVANLPKKKLTYNSQAEGSSYCRSLGKFDFPKGTSERWIQNYYKNECIQNETKPKWNGEYREKAKCYTATGLCANNNLCTYIDCIANESATVKCLNEPVSIDICIKYKVAPTDVMGSVAVELVSTAGPTAIPDCQGTCPGKSREMPKGFCDFSSKMICDCKPGTSKPRWLPTNICPSPTPAPTSAPAVVVAGPVTCTGRCPGGSGNTFEIGYEDKTSGKFCSCARGLSYPTWEKINVVPATPGVECKSGGYIITISSTPFHYDPADNFCIKTVENKNTEYKCLNDGSKIIGKSERDIVNCPMNAPVKRAATPVAVVVPTNPECMYAGSPLTETSNPYHYDPADNFCIKKIDNKKVGVKCKNDGTKIIGGSIDDLANCSEPQAPCNIISGYGWAEVEYDVNRILTNYAVCRAFGGVNSEGINCENKKIADAYCQCKDEIDNGYATLETLPDYCKEINYPTPPAPLVFQ